MTSTASDTSDPRDPRRPVASPSRTTVQVGEQDKWVGPASAEDALNKAKLARRAARHADDTFNASDYERAIAEREDRKAQTYALLSIAESLVKLSRAVRQINEHGIRIEAGSSSDPES